MSHLCRLPLEGVSAKWLNFSPIIAHNPPHNFQPFCPNPRKPECKYILRKAACYFHSFRSTIAPICLYSWTSTSEATNLIPGPLHWGNIPWLHFVQLQQWQPWPLAFRSTQHSIFANSCELPLRPRCCCNTGRTSLSMTTQSSTFSPSSSGIGSD